MPFGPRVFDGPAFLRSIGITEDDQPTRDQLNLCWPKYTKDPHEKMTRVCACFLSLSNAIISSLISFLSTQSDFHAFMQDATKLIGDGGVDVAEIREEADVRFWIQTQYLTHTS
jgi:hypothetical protein